MKLEDAAKVSTITLAISEIQDQINKEAFNIKQAKGIIKASTERIGTGKRLLAENISKLGELGINIE